MSNFTAILLIHQWTSSTHYIPSLAELLTELHTVSTAEAAAAGFRVLSPGNHRQEIQDKITMVKSGLGKSAALEFR